MKQNQLWVTIVVAAVVAVIVSWLVVAYTNPALSPAIGSSSERAPVTIFPDLIVNDVSLLATACGNFTGCSANFSVSVQNVGGSRAGASETFFVLEGPDQRYFGASTHALGPGESTVMVFGFGSLAEGLYNVTAVADIDNVVRESNENNNNFTTAFYIP